MLLAAVAAGGIAWELAALIAAVARRRVTVRGLIFRLIVIAAAPLAAIVLALRGCPAETWLAGASMVAVALCGTAWCVRSYGRTTNPVRRPWKLLLLSLRIAVVAILVLLVCRPAIQNSSIKKIRGTVLIGIDASSSMQRRDMPQSYRRENLDSGEEPQTRISAVTQALEDSRSRIQNIMDSADVDIFTFSDKAFDFTGRGYDIQATGAATAIGDAAASAFESHAAAGRDIHAIVLLTDGCNNTADVISPDKLAELMGARGVAVFTVGAGSEKATESSHILNVKNLTAPDEVEVYNRLPISCRIETISLAGRQIEVICTFGDETVATKTLDIADSQQDETCRFEHIPTTSGFRRLSVIARVVGEQPRDLTGESAANRLVQVTNRELKVLYVEGKVRYESKYVARALASSRRITLDRRVILDKSGAAELGENIDDWLQYHAIIFGDIAASQFTPKQLEIIRTLVDEYGKGFAMIGGRNSFGSGGWADTPIADVLGVNMRLSAGNVDGMIKVAPTEAGLKNELMKIGESPEIADDWGKLPEMPGANRLAGIKEAAEVLATTSDGIPLIVAHRYGKGRSLAIAFDTTWRWVLSPKETAESQKTFWRQVAMFLAAPQGHIWISTDKTSYDLRRLAAGSDMINVAAGLEDSAGLPVTNVPVSVTLIDGSGNETPVELNVSGRIRSGMLAPPAASGLYRLTIAADFEGRRMQAEYQFDVTSKDLEAAEILADFGLLRRMAAAGNGRFVPLKDFCSLLEDIQAAAAPKVRRVIEHEDLSAEWRWYAVITVISLMCIEWMLRKRLGLV